MQQSEVLTGDQQERLHCELSWLCGIIDADGCINFDIINTKKAKRIKPRIFVLTNTNYNLILEVCKILKDLSFGYYIQERKSRNPNHADRWDVMVVGYKRCQKMLPFLIPFLRGKKDQAMLMLEFVNQRVNDVSKYGHKGVGWHTDKQMELVACVKELNRTGKMSPKQCNILRD